ncbi:FlgO family outer membrane protein [Desulfomarina sp.]
MMNSITRHLSILALVLFLSSFLVSVTPRNSSADFQKTKIAVLDFVLHGDKLNTQGMGAIISEWFITSIVKSGRFDVVERAMLQKIISEQKLATTGLIDENSASELGKILGVKVIITGSVLKLKNSIEINSRVISVESGSIIAAENIRGSASDDLQSLVELLTKRIIRNFPLTGYIVKRDGKSVIVDLGLTAGLDYGTEFIVFKEGEVIKHPKTGEVLDVEQIHTGKIRITKVRRNVAEGIILQENKIGIAYGQMVQSIQKTTAVRPQPPRQLKMEEPFVPGPAPAPAEKIVLKRNKQKIIPPRKVKRSKQPDLKKEPAVVETVAEKRPEILNVGIFPWVFDDEGISFLSYLKDNLKYRIDDSDKLRLKKSYYKIKKIAKLKASGSSKKYYTRTNLKLSAIKATAKKENIHLAVLGRLNIHCRWSDNCQVRHMKIILLDLTTGKSIIKEGSSWDMEARDFIDSILSKTFKELNRNLDRD